MKKALVITLTSLSAVLGLFLVIVLPLLLGNVQIPEAEAEERPTVQEVTKREPVTEEALLVAINVERAKAGVGALVIDQTLNQSAKWKAVRMNETMNYEHTDPVTGKKDGLEYLVSLKPGCSKVSENFTGSQFGASMTIDRAVKNWMGSPSHREALLNPVYTRTGFGIERNLIVQHFCQP